MNLTGLDLALFSSALLLGSALVWMTIRLCRRRGWVARPRSDRWHRTTPSLYGGVPIWLTFLVISLASLARASRMTRELVAASSFVFLLGLADDILHLRPLTKLVGQIVAALFVVGSGFIYPLVHNSDINFAVSVLWIVGISNAFNLLDNMDGLAAGVAVISAAYLALFYVGPDSSEYHRLALIAAAAAAGFLVFNFYPARIFMGDCGSLFLGFLLGSLCLPQVTHISGLPTFVLAPCVVLGVPVFDTVFVSVTRRLRGQPISQGGTDHSSHRLVQLGLSERAAVLLLLALSLISGAVALTARHAFYSRAVILTGAWFLALLLFGTYLSRSDTTMSLQCRLSMDCDPKRDFTTSVPAPASARLRIFGPPVTAPYPIDSGPIDSGSIDSGAIDSRAIDSHAIDAPTDDGVDNRASAPSLTV